MGGAALEALAGQLCEILDVLKAERPEQYKADDGGDQ